MGLELPPRRSAGQYVGAVRSGNLVFVSGAGPVGPEGMVTGKLGVELDVEAGKEAARLCALSCLSALQETIGDLDKVTRIVAARLREQRPRLQPSARSGGRGVLLPAIVVR